MLASRHIVADDNERSDKDSQKNHNAQVDKAFFTVLVHNNIDFIRLDYWGLLLCRLRSSMLLDNLRSQQLPSLFEADFAHHR